MVSPLATQVYAFLRTVPAGKVVTYGQIATYLGNPHLARVVGNILHHNPDPDHTPCFRVVNSAGRLAPNFAIDGPEEQQRRLEADGIEVKNLHVDLSRYQYQPPSLPRLN